MSKKQLGTSSTLFLAIDDRSKKHIARSSKQPLSINGSATIKTSLGTSVTSSIVSIAVDGPSKKAIKHSLSLFCAVDGPSKIETTKHSNLVCAVDGPSKKSIGHSSTLFGAVDGSAVINNALGSVFTAVGVSDASGVGSSTGGGGGGGGGGGSECDDATGMAFIVLNTESVDAGDTLWFLLGVVTGMTYHITTTEYDGLVFHSKYLTGDTCDTATEFSDLPSSGNCSAFTATGSNLYIWLQNYSDTTQTASWSVNIGQCGP